MTASLLDAWCPEPHERVITAVAWDRTSGQRATGDAEGKVALAVPGADLGTPPRTWAHVAAVRGLALSPGGALVAVGDDAGTLAVYRTSDGEAVLVDAREDGTGAQRAMRGVAFSPDGDRVAALGADGRLRILNVRTRERTATFPDFSGSVVGWDDTGARLVAVDHLRQPVVVDLVGRRRLPLPTIPGGATLARFVPGFDRVIVLGTTGLYLVDVAAGAVIAQRLADRSSGMLDLVLSPDGDRFAVITARSVHLFEVDGVRFLESLRHGAPDPSGVAVWDDQGVSVAGHDARLHRADHDAALPPSVCVTGMGDWRVVGHEHMVAVWQSQHRRRTFVPPVAAPGETTAAPLPPGGRIVEARIDRDGRLLALLPERLPVQVYEGDTGRWLFSMGEDTVDAPRFEVGVGVVGCLLPQGGMRWFDLTQNARFELSWVQDFDITGGGTWLAVVTPKGRVRILDPHTGKTILPEIGPLDDAPIRALSFGEALPHLLLLDADGVLGLVDLEPSARSGKPPESYRICQIHDAVVDQVWGLSDDRRAALRIQEHDGTATIAFVDLDTGQVDREAKNLLPYAVVDPISGTILEPARGAALLEREAGGGELRVLRSMAGGEWVTFGAAGITAASGGARRLLGGRRPT